jgi:hypothetical protein
MEKPAMLLVRHGCTLAASVFGIGCGCASVGWVVGVDGTTSFELLSEALPLSHQENSAEMLVILSQNSM